MTGGRASEWGIVGGGVAVLNGLAALQHWGLSEGGTWAPSHLILPTLLGLVAGFGLIRLWRQRRQLRRLQAEQQRQNEALQLLQGTVRDLETERSAAALQASAELDSLASVTGDVAHDFNNLLTAVLHGAELVGEMAHEPETVREVAGEVLDAASRAAELTDRLMAFGRRRALPAPDRVVDLAAVIRAMSDGIVRQMGDRSLVSIQLAPELPSIRANPAHLEQVVEHLCTNARAAMPDGGRLSIQAMHLASSELEGLLPGERGAGAVCLRVQDTGAEISEEDAARIFDPWFSTRGSNGGLGLSMVAHLVSRAGGMVRLVRPAQSGAVFEVFWPVHGLEPALGTAVRSVASEGARVAKNSCSQAFLVIDDDAAVRELVARGLRARGHVVVETADGDAAERAVRAQDVQFDVILSDIDMPGRSGVTLAPLWAELMPAARVVLMTGSSEHLLDPAAVGDLAVVGVLRKPFEIVRLEALLSS